MMLLLQVADSGSPTGWTTFSKHRNLSNALAHELILHKRKPQFWTRIARNTPDNYPPGHRSACNCIVCQMQAVFDALPIPDECPNCLRSLVLMAPNPKPWYVVPAWPCALHIEESTGRFSTSH
jgi:hypothetical protein